MIAPLLCALLAAPDGTDDRLARATAQARAAAQAFWNGGDRRLVEPATAEGERVLAVLDPERAHRVEAARLLMAMGALYRVRSEPARAVEAYERARAVYAGVGDARGVVIAHMSLGATHGESGDHDQELRQRRLALQEAIARKVSASLLKDVYHSLVEVHERLARTSEAIGYLRLYDRALEEVEPTGATAGWRRWPAPVSDDLHDAAFVDPLHGLLLAHHTGRILATRDGGTTWTEVADLADGYLEAIHFLDASTGFVAGEGGRLLRTIDAGRTWVVAVGEAPVAYSALHFLDARRGFALGRNTWTGAPVWLWTEDGGLEWKDRGVTLPAGTFTDAIAADGTGLVVLLGDRDIVRTNDAGRTWTQEPNPTRDRLRGAAFAGCGPAFAVGAKGALLRSPGGAAGWSPVPRFTDALLRDVHFVDARRGFVVGNRDANGHSFWQTTDGGATWRPVPGDYPNLHRLVATGERLLALGAGFALYSWTNRAD